MEARANPTDRDLWEPSPWQPADIQQQIADGTRPDPSTVVGLFWDPCGNQMVADGTNQVPQYFVRRVQSWDLPGLITCFGQARTFKELYMVWNQMPICISGKRRGEDTETIKAKKHQEIQKRNHTLRDMGRFLKVIGVPFPKSQEEIKILYREMGSFLAASVILAHTPLEVMNLPEAGIQDTKEQISPSRFRPSKTMGRSTRSLQPVLVSNQCLRSGWRGVASTLFGGWQLRMMPWRLTCIARLATPRRQWRL